jgi:acyl transferase domain-containing protein
VSALFLEIHGTLVRSEASLMAGGVDSVAAAEFVNMLAVSLKMSVPKTLLFDHPTIEGVTSVVAEMRRTQNSDENCRVRFPATEGGELKAVAQAQPPHSVTSFSKRFSFVLPGPCLHDAGLKSFVAGARAASSRVPASRLDARETSSATYGAFVIESTFALDAAAFGVSRTEARALNPQMTLVLNASYSALVEDSPTPRSSFRSSLANTPVGFFLGAGGNLASPRVERATLSGLITTPLAPKELSVYSGTSSALSVASGRVSYSLGLVGPCLTLDTACSSSLVAVHLSASALRLAECPRGVATGVGLLTAGVTAAFAAAGMLSRLGRSHSFDRRADGYCRGEGCGAFVLWRPREGDAAADFSVAGSAVQQDGPSASLTAPNGSSQRRLIG